MATFAQFAFVVPDMPLEMGVGYLSIVFGALLWWFGLTWLVDKIRGKFDTNGILIINKVIGSVVIICSVIALIGTIFKGKAKFLVSTLDGSSAAVLGASAVGWDL